MLLTLHHALFILISFNVALTRFKLGANAILAVLLAVCKVGAMVNKIPLYQVC
jgi:enolase